MFALTPEMVLHGYSLGIFPMADPDDNNEISWYEPHERGILPLEGLKVSKSLRKTIEQGKFNVTLDHDFEGVIRACAERDETWISEEIIQVYLELHRMGFAHSVECWQEERLAGGLYGVALQKAFFGESMFHRVTDASKVALFYLVEWLKAHHFLLLDMQYITPHLASLGGIEISAAEFQKRLKKALKG